MALSINELDLEVTEYLPAREVMSAVITGPTDSQVGSYELDYEPVCVFAEGNHDNAYGDGDFNGWNIQSIAGDDAFLGTVVGEEAPPPPDNGGA
jgi:hypothetical protein